MKTLLKAVACLGLTAWLGGQDTLKEISVLIPVQVRVYRGGDFVDNLSLPDFQLWEDGSRQRIEGFYHIRGGGIRRSEEGQRLIPDLARHFYLFFEIEAYTPEVRRSVRVFLNKVLQPGDNLTLITPERAYRMKSDALRNMPVRELFRQAEALFRDQALTANVEYRTAMSDLSALTESASVSPPGEGAAETLDPGKTGQLGGLTWDALITRYSSLLSAVEKFRKIDELRLLDHVRTLRFEEGQKYAWFFYQREPLPRLPSAFLSDFVRQNQERRDVIQILSYLFDSPGRDFHVDAERMGRALADASVLLHFILFDMPRGDDLADLERRRLESLYDKLDEIAFASGAVIDCRRTPEDIMAATRSALDEYYLLLYTPGFYAGDGRFKPIEIRIGDRRYRVAHRVGYIAE